MAGLYPTLVLPLQRGGSLRNGILKKLGEPTPTENPEEPYLKRRLPDECP
jgi:hypothetical protein